MQRMVKAFCFAFARAGKQQRRENRNDGNHNQQLDQGEGSRRQPFAR